MKRRTLKPLQPRHVTVFKIRNRRGYAAICLKNLTEGKTPAQAFARLMHPLKRLGFALPAWVPKAQ